MLGVLVEIIFHVLVLRSTKSSIAFTAIVTLLCFSAAVVAIIRDAVF